MIGYPSAISTNKGKQRDAQIKGATATAEAMQDFANRAAGRSIPFVMGDINTGIGLNEDGSVWESGVGSFHLARLGPVCPCWQAWLEQGQFEDAASQFETAGPTYF